MPKTTIVGRMRLKTGFALNHLKAATNAARAAYKIEQANKGAAFGPWFDGLVVAVPVSVVMAAAALEANANESLQNILDGFTNHRLSPCGRTLLTDLKEDRSGNATEKYRRIALLTDKEPKTDHEHWRQAKLLLKFRNEFMHFRPTWDDEDFHSKGFTEEMKKLVPVVDAYKGNFIFPHGFMTYGCAKWAVETVLVFSHEFGKLLDIKNGFEAAASDFTLP